MNGLHVAGVATITADAQVRTSKTGRPWLTLLATIEAAPSEYLQLSVSSFSSDAIDIADSLTKDVEFYFEGRLRERSWHNADTGTQLKRLCVTASILQPMALIGERKPKKPRQPKRPAAASPEKRAPDFNDSLPF